MPGATASDCHSAPMSERALPHHSASSLRACPGPDPGTPRRLEKADARQVFRNRGDPWNRVPGVGQTWRRNALSRCVAMRRSMSVLNDLRWRLVCASRSIQIANAITVHHFGVLLPVRFDKRQAALIRIIAAAHAVRDGCHRVGYSPGGHPGATDDPDRTVGPASWPSAPEQSVC